jgi:tRNA modification GTPase
MGVEKAKEFVVTADLILLLLDASLPLSAEDREVLTMLSGKQAIVLVNKTDLPVLLNLDEVYTYIADTKVLKISVMEGTGLPELEQMIVDMVYGGEIAQKEGAFLTNLRQANLLEQGKYHLEATIATIDEGMPSDCIVIDLKESWDKLGEITGDTVGEDIIDQIFTQFCIGK